MLYTTLEHTRVYQEAMEEGEKKAVTKFIFRALKKKFAEEVSEEMRARISGLPLATLHSLSEDLLDFTTFADLQPWLHQN